VVEHAAPAKTTEGTSRTGELMREVRRMPIFHQLVPAEAGVGWPLPSRKAGRLYLTLPFFGMPPTGTKGETPLYPPFATMTLDWHTAKPVAYSDLHATRPWPPIAVRVGTFPHAEVRRLKRAEYLRLREELLRLCDEVFASLAGGSRLRRESVSRYRELWRLLMEPSLEPYYRHLAPGFTERFLPAPKPAG
jgi:hypothetical protein